jgi:hypothetical protein
MIKKLMRVLFGPPRDINDPHTYHHISLIAFLAWVGLGVHQLLTVQRIFRGHYKNILFASVGVVDAVSMKGIAEAEALRLQTEGDLKRYVALAHALGLHAAFRCAIGTEAVGQATELCLEIARDFPHAIFFAGKLVFESEQWYQRVLHNETAYQIQRRLQFAGLNAMVLPVRVMDFPPVPAAG